MTVVALPPSRLKITGTDGSFTAPINPAELSTGLAISYDAARTVGRGRSKLSMPSVGNETLSFALVLDGTGAVPGPEGQAVLDVPQQIALLRKIVGFKPQKPAESTEEAPVVQVSWAARIWPCRINDLSVDYTLFAPTGKPLRAKLQLSFAVFRGLAAAPTPASPPPPPAPTPGPTPAPTPGPSPSPVGEPNEYEGVAGLFGEGDDNEVAVAAAPEAADGADNAGDSEAGAADGEEDDAASGLPLSIRIKSDGTEVQDLHSPHALRIRSAVNAIPSAELEFIDGDMAAGTMPSSDGEHFKPGAVIEIAAGYGEAAPKPLFKGLVVKHSLRMDSGGQARLVIECRHAAVRMTARRKNANYLAQTDDAIIQALVSAAGLSAEVDATTVTHGELVQHYCSDWDFMLARAEANGLLVTVGDTLKVKAPVADGAAALTVRYGEDLIEFDAEIDARTQYATAKAVAWDPKTQKAVLSDEAAPAGPAGQGDLSSATLAEVMGSAALRLQSGAPLSKEALTAWAKALQLKAGLARVRGRMRVQGRAALVPGALVQLENMGTRFSGQVYTSGVRHELIDGDWTSDVEFGLAPEWFVERQDVRAPSAAGLLPAIEGLQVGVVLKLDGDPASAHRIQVSVPVLEAEKAGVWARLMQFHGSNGIGSFFVPEVGDEVVLGYFGNDPSHPVVLGSLYSSTRPMPYALAAENNTKALVTRCLSKIEFDEDKKVITVTTPGKNKVVISDTDQSILLQDQNDNKLTLGPGGITLDSPKDIQLIAKGRIVLDATGVASIASKADVTLDAGVNLQCQAKVAYAAKGTTAELSASGQTVVKGAMVLIN